MKRTGKRSMSTGAHVDYDTHADCVIQLRLLQEASDEEIFFESWTCSRDDETNDGVRESV